MIKREIVTEAMYNAIRLGATKMPPDIRRSTLQLMAMAQGALNMK